MSESDTIGVLEPQVPLPLLHRGKVRDVFDVGDGRLLMVASDRVSAFDIVMRQAIPRKGEVLTQITAWWMKQLEGITAHHLIETIHAHPTYSEVMMEAVASALGVTVHM